MIVYQSFNSKGNYDYNPMFYQNFHIIQHFHKNLELVYVADGILEVTVNGRTEHLHKHEFALILSNQIHSFHTSESSSCWIAVFSENFVYEFAKSVSGSEGACSKFVCTENIRQYLEQELIREETPELLLLKSLLYAACAEYLRQVPLLPQGKSNDISHQIISYIYAHYQQEITLKDVAEKLGYEYHYASRCFNNIFQTNFKTFLNEYRCERAKQLLLHGDMSVTDVAFESGFQSIRNFNRIFREYTGKEPRYYANHILQKKSDDSDPKQ